MKIIKTISAAVLILGALPAAADQTADAKAALADIEKTLGFVPDFLKSLPDPVLPGTWEEMKGLQMSQTTALSAKYKELIGLAVSAQIPCKYCIIGHTEFAKANGATKGELGLAIAEASLTRHWSTFLNGAQIDEGKFRSEIDQALAQLKAVDPRAPAPPPNAVKDSQSVYLDVERSYGLVPGFIKAFPTSGVVGAWKAMRDVEMNPKGALPPKVISLVGLAVASQVPCHYCVLADAAFAKASGATDAEISEAIAMAAFTRQMSTLLNGLQVNEAKFKADVTRLTRPKGKTIAAR